MYNKVQIEAIKLAVWNLEAKRCHSKEILKDSMIWLIERYKQDNDSIYLEKEVDHIYAYLELGFSFEEISQYVSFVLENGKIDAAELTALKKKCCPKIRLNKSSIRGLMGRWNPNLHSMPIAEVVNDIMMKVGEKQQGEYLYHCGKRLSGQEDDGIWENTYRLLINEEGAVFQDVNQYKYYQLM